MEITNGNTLRRPIRAEGERVTLVGHASVFMAMQATRQSRKQRKLVFVCELIPLHEKKSFLKFFGVRWLRA